MSRNGKKKKKGTGKRGRPRKEEVKPGISTETKHGIWAVVLFVVALFLFLSAFGAAGVAGAFVYKILYYLLGVGYILLPTLLMLVGYSFVHSKMPNIGMTRTLSSTAFLLSGLGIVNIASTNNSGGILGRIMSGPLVKLFDVYATIFFLGGILIISLFVMFDTKPELATFFSRLTSIFRKKDSGEEDEEEYEDEEYEEEVYEDEEEEYEEEADEEEEEEEVVEKEEKKSKKKKKGAFIAKNEEDELPMNTNETYATGDYKAPPISLLEVDKGKPNTGDIKANANVIKRTLQNFGIEVEMDEITIGPTVTRYALKPAEGVKLSKIVSLQNDLALALAAHPLRIEAPIPGKSLVGIEIPNKSKATVGLGTLLSDSKFKTTSDPLTIALGRSISGRSKFGNLAKMPHALVAGTTGSGKSVTIHSIITSLLYRNGPEDLKMIMVDPKRVELTLYKNIPHLLTPVITDPKKTILALKWAAKEMNRRYDVLEENSVRDIQSYHKNVLKAKKSDEEEAPERMPYIVIIIDELADIMTTYPRELETGIVRLAQMSRAVGIHLILSTQRPEVNVVTGLIKANVPARVALKVSSQIDSRTILDTGGAEKLLGAGDMLYSSGTSQPERLQSAFISEGEVKKIVKYLKDSYKDELIEEISLSGGSDAADKGIFESTLDDEDEDEMYEEARQLVIETGKASTSFLQRKLKLGYARAARLMDTLEERGVVGPADGAKPREVLEKLEQDEDGNNIVE